MRLVLLSPEQVACQPEVRSAWDSCQAANSGLYSLYQSMAWWDHLVATRSSQQLYLGLCMTPSDVLAAAIPLMSREFLLPFEFGRRCPAAIPFHVVSAITVDPLLRLAPVDSLVLLNSLATRCPADHGFYVKSIDVATPLWAEIAARPTLSDSFIYIVDGVRPLYSIILPRTFDEYLQKFSGKTRNTLRRKVKALKEEGAGKMTLTRISAADDVPDFLDAARAIGKLSWKKRGAGWFHTASQADCDQIKDSACRGFLRSYLLRVGDIPCAFVNGYQYDGVYHYADLAYDERFAKWSPGLILLFLLLEDLFLQNRPMYLNFGIGYADYKQQFANQVAQDASLLILRRSFANRLRVGLHSGFLGIKYWARRHFQINREQAHEPQACPD